MAISKVKLKDGITHYQAVIWKNGRRLRSKVFKTRQAAKVWHGAEETSLNPTPPPNIRSITLSRYWSEHYFPNLRVTASTSYDYNCMWLKHIRERLGDFRLVEISSEDCQSCIHAVVKNGCSPARANKVRALLSGIFQTAEQKSLCRNVLKSVKQFRPELRLRKIWSAEEAQIFLGYLQKKQSAWFAFYLVAYETGLRFAELAGLSWNAVDLENSVINVVQTYCAISKTLAPSTKGGRSRIAYLSETASKSLRAMERNSPNGLVFLGNGPVRHSSIRKSFPALQSKAGVTVIGFHGIRHSFASHFLQAGGSIHELQGLLGHRDIKTTLLYSHFGNSQLREAAGLVRMRTVGDGSPISQLFQE